MWCLSRKARNRLQHALNGNGPPGSSRPGRSGPEWKVAGRLDGKLLSEPQPAAKLRSMGWSLPDAVPADYMLRVYDTRLEDEWLRALATEMVGIDVDSYIVGGNFLTQPHLEDGPAFHSSPIRRWGPSGPEAYHIVIPPRPHLAAWLQRCHHQLPVESPAARFSVCCIVPRDACPATLDAAAIQRLVPQAEPLLRDPAVELHASVLGERPPIIRVPATERQLPPSAWEHARLPLNKVLLVLQFRSRSGQSVAPAGGWIRGQLPAPSPSPLELLRLEFMLPPATRQKDAERLARKGLDKIAKELQLPSPAPHQLRNIQPTHGSVAAVFGVPRALAMQWLRGSGCGGLYLRPFWTENSSAEMARDRFELLWLRNKLADGPRIWGAVKDLPSVVGLLPGDKDVAVRVQAGCSPEALQALQAQVQFVLEDKQAQLRRPVPGQRWWRLGPLTEAECWKLQEMVAATGLVPLRGELRVARMGPFRSAVYFAVTGERTRWSLDDGSWSASEARLTPAEPPPRRQPASAANPRASQSGVSILAGSSWAGPRRGQATAQFSVPSAAGDADPSQHQSAGPTAPVTPRPPAVPRRVDFPPLQPTASRQPASAGPVSHPRQRQRGGASQQPAHSLEDRLDLLLEQLQRLERNNADLAAQLQQLREENTLLRRQLAAAPTTHQPYGPPPGTSLYGASHNSARPCTPPREPSAADDVEMSPPSVPDPKRSRLQLEHAAAGTGVGPVPFPGPPPGHGL